MAAASQPMPPLAAVQSALYRITEGLAAGIGRDLSEPPSWSELEWRLAPAVAAIHGVSPLLAGARWPGPLHWSRFLTEQRQHTLLRQQRIAGLLASIDERSRTAGIPIIGLKGTALQAAGVYAAGERPMADIDLLVRPTDVEATVAVLLALSYQDAGTTWKHQGFEPPDAGQRTALGEHADNPIKIDLHHRVCERLPLIESDLTDLVFPPRAQPGLNGYSRAAALLVHVLAHAAGSMTSRALRLIQLCDITRLSRRLAGPDWEEILRWHGTDDRLWWAAPPLLLAARYCPDTVPQEVLAGLERGCPWILRRISRRRRLADFSHSHLYIDPVPGIIWTGSPVQAMRYVSSRIFPTAEQRAQMQLASRTGPYSADPSWFRQSQARRILQWLTSRPTRTQTLQPVRAALSRTS